MFLPLPTQANLRGGYNYTKTIIIVFGTIGIVIEKSLKFRSKYLQSSLNQAGFIYADFRWWIEPHHYRSYASAETAVTILEREKKGTLTKKALGRFQ